MLLHGKMKTKTIKQKTSPKTHKSRNKVAKKWTRKGEGRISKSFIPVYERSEHAMSPPVNFAVGITPAVEFERS